MSDPLALCDTGTPFRRTLAFREPTTRELERGDR
jgi:hypothetical protein